MQLPLAKLSGFLLLLLLLNTGFVTSEEDYDDYEGYGDYGDYDVCNFYDDGNQYAGECTHGKFPKKTLYDVYGPNVSTCCEEHSYLFVDKCPVRIVNMNIDRCH